MPATQIHAHCGVGGGSVIGVPSASFFVPGFCSGMDLSSRHWTSRLRQSPEHGIEAHLDALGGSFFRRRLSANRPAKKVAAIQQSNLPEQAPRTANSLSMKMSVVARLCLAALLKP